MIKWSGYVFANVRVPNAKEKKSLSYVVLSLCVCVCGVGGTLQRNFVGSFILNLVFIFSLQFPGHLTLNCKSEVQGSIPGLVTYCRFSFH